MGAAARRAAWVLALLLMWASLPAGADHELFQCDAGNCETTGGTTEGDCGPTNQTACTLDPADKVGCGPPLTDVQTPPLPNLGEIGTIRIEPGDPLEEGLELVDPNDPPDPGSATEPPCPDYHQACVDASDGGCWVGTLQPLEADWPVQADQVEPNVCDDALDVCEARHKPLYAGDTADFYYAFLPEGLHEFTMGQASAPWDYSLCVYDPLDKLHSDPQPNRFPPDPGSLQVNVGTDGSVSASASAGSVETVMIDSDRAGLYHIGVVAAESCPQQLPIGIPEERSVVGDAADAVVTKAQAAREVAESLVVQNPLAAGPSLQGMLDALGSVGVPTAKACAPNCAVYLIQSYCFGVKTIADAS